MPRVFADGDGSFRLELTPVRRYRCKGRLACGAACASVTSGSDGERWGGCLGMPLEIPWRFQIAAATGNGQRLIFAVCPELVKSVIVLFKKGKICPIWLKKKVKIVFTFLTSQNWGKSAREILKKRGKSGRFSLLKKNRKKLFYQPA